MSLQPGTRIPRLAETTHERYDAMWRSCIAQDRAWWRDVCTWAAAAFTAGLMAGFLMAALAWSHLGG